MFLSRILSFQEPAQYECKRGRPKSKPAGGFSTTTSHHTIMSFSRSLISSLPRAAQSSSRAFSSSLPRHIPSIYVSPSASDVARSVQTEADGLFRPSSFPFPSQSTLGSKEKIKSKLKELGITPISIKPRRASGFDVEIAKGDVETALRNEVSSCSFAHLVLLRLMSSSYPLIISRSAPR
jgi:hypothetical protein